MGIPFSVYPLYTFTYCFSREIRYQREGEGNRIEKEKKNNISISSTKIMSVFARKEPQTEFFLFAHSFQSREIVDERREERLIFCGTSSLFHCRFFSSSVVFVIHLRERNEDKHMRNAIHLCHPSIPFTNRNSNLLLQRISHEEESLQMESSVILWRWSLGKQRATRNYFINESNHECISCFQYRIDFSFQRHKWKMTSS